MPQFAANLGFLFQEVDLLARYDAAAGAGFRGVETPFPYSLSPETLAARLQPWPLLNATARTTRSNGSPVLNAGWTRWPASAPFGMPIRCSL